jgi:NTE family protein
MKRALVLGGGGNVGVAWETALAAGLMDGGVDVRDADVVIGTSAGSVVGTQLALGRDPREMLRDLREAPPQPIGGTSFTPDAEATNAIFAAWGTADAMDETLCRHVGGLALRAHTMPEQEWVGLYARRGWPGWPERMLLVTAVDCDSGKGVVFERGSGVPIERAVAASCTVPGLFPPVAIDGRRYMDGGVWSMTWADLALRIQPDIVLIIATIGTSERGIHKLAARQIARESSVIRDAGASVVVVQFDDATRAAAGDNLMDPSTRLPVAAAGEAQGRRIAVDVARAWCD